MVRCAFLLGGALLSLAPHASATARRLVDRSIVSIPETAGQFTLASAHYSELDPERGVEAYYTFTDAPEAMYVILRVRFQGRMERKAAMERIGKQADEAVRRTAGDDRFELGPRRKIWLARPPSLVRASHRQARRSHAAVLRIDTLSPATTRTHRVGVFAYRDLHQFQVLVHGNSRRMSFSRLRALGRKAANAILPRVDVRNFGSCGETAAVSTRERKRSIRRAIEENCAPSGTEAELLPLRGRSFNVHYPAGS